MFRHISFLVQGFFASKKVFPWVLRYIKAVFACSLTAIVSSLGAHIRSWAYN